MLYLTCAVLMIGGIIATFSRGGFLGLICSGGVLAWKLARRNKWLMGAVLPMVILLFVLLAPGGYGNRISTTSDESAIARMDDLKRSIFIAAHHPLLGVGINNYILFSNKDKATHNSYTQVASEMGLTALALYLMFLFTSLKQLRRISKETSAARHRSRFFYLAVGLEASLIGYMVSSFFASVAYLWYVYYLVGYTLCLKDLYEVSKFADERQKICSMTAR
jgi:putative inorganic carbon (HCO3(-)) transporter